MANEHRTCVRCIMDETDPDIVFDEFGVCNHCHRYDEQSLRRLVPLDQRELHLASLVERIKQDGAGRDYDCVIGVSGGLDSTFVAYLARQRGLRPLAVHFDNGWDSELAVANIERVLKGLNIDLSTYVVDWEEFRDLQVSFLKASTPDGEVPTDHAIVAVLYQVAAKLGIRYILPGTNVASESIMPAKWGYGYSDYRYIRSVQRTFGTARLQSYPHYSLPKLFEYMVIRGIRLVSILDYVKYDKESAMSEMQEKLGWVSYGGKHHESIYTRFYQAYVLPRKFKIDKRRAHFSNLMLSGQMTREDALRIIGEPSCPESVSLADREYVVKKLALSFKEFDAMMAAPTLTFHDYPNNYRLIELAKGVLRRVNDDFLRGA